MKILELERQQRELAHKREVEEEELKGIIRLESLMAETDHELAEARKAAAIMELEAKLTTEMEGRLTGEETTPTVKSTPLNTHPLHLTVLLILQGPPSRIPHP